MEIGFKRGNAQNVFAYHPMQSAFTGKKGCYPSFKRPYIKETYFNATAKTRKAEPEKPLKPDGKP